MSDPQRNRLDGRRPGWTLVETTIAMLVGTIALMALAGVMISTSYLHALSLSRMEQTSVAETKLDQLRSHAALETADTVKLAVGGSVTSDVANHNEQVTTTRGRTYYVRWQVAGGTNGTRAVTLRVAPVSARKNEVPYVEYSTLILIQ